MSIDITDVGATIHRLWLYGLLPDRDPDLELPWMAELRELIPNITHDELRRATIRVGVSTTSDAPPITPVTIADEVHFERDAGYMRAEGGAK